MTREAIAIVLGFAFGAADLRLDQLARVLCVDQDANAKLDMLLGKFGLEWRR